MKTIFFIDDDPFITTIYRTRLSHDGYCIETANTGTDALEKLNTMAPDLIVLDLIMPGMNGVDVLKQIRARPDTHDCPVIILSNCYVQNLVNEAMSLGVSQIFTKALCPPNKMVTEIKKFMEGLPEHRAVALFRASSGETRVAPNPLAALDAAAETTWQATDLLSLPADASLETRRKALAGLYRSVRPRLNDALADNPGSELETLAKTLLGLFGDFYGNPDHMTRTSIQTLLRGLGNLNRAKLPPANHAPPRQSVLDAVLRRQNLDQTGAPLSE